MNLNQITAFRAVMSSPSLSEAARKLGRTQPAVSLAIKGLEEKLGMPLFRREGRQMIPVPEAHYLASQAEDILNQLSAVTRTMQSLATGTAGTLNVAAMPGAAAYLFPHFIAESISPTSDITVNMSARSAPQIQELARAQSIDFGFADAPADGADHKEYEMELITADCLVALPADHPLAKKTEIALQDLDGLPMGTLQGDHTHKRRTQSLFRGGGCSFNQVIDSQTFLSLLQFVRAKHCLAILDPLTRVTDGEVGLTRGEVVYRPLIEDIRYDYVVIWPRYRPLSQLALHMKDAWRDHVIELLDKFSAAPETGQHMAIPDQPFPVEQA